ncbi:uracil-DNA glycosylase [Vogesella sp. DC21W]|uniref:Type-4 uracil-DNA glycosylase n=1 Tax=Vogesella aquatica TaxID=2984206 RepID=A0ABT5IXF7_9NEIS|nr:uracil-DNA glycosylase [Vogesella aquatica]MDC7717254.1 uracil-DNA glycosylase [Vogesella aquatica]
MNRRAFVLHEMGHSPLWLPRGASLPDDRQLTHIEPDATALAPSIEPVPTVAPAAAPARISLLEQPGSPPSGQPITDWATLHTSIASCQRCELAKTRHNVVVGRGKPTARLLIVGEAPGEQEDRQGQPFVGKAGQLLESMLAAVGMDSMQDVYICNVVKCRPPGNRNPAPAEIASCASYLQWQIDTIQPALIVALGRFAAHTLLNSQAPISALRKQLHHAHGRPVLVTFHPAYLLRSPGEKAKAWQDWHQIKCQLAEPGKVTTSAC